MTEAASAEARVLARRRRPFGDHVASEVAKLQTGYLQVRPAAVAVMARLRAAAGTLAGSRLDVLQVTSVHPDFLPKRIGDDPVHVEHAKHAALTLYAVHQQSYRERGLHRDGFGLGQAVGLLARERGNPEAVRRRFAALGTAVNFAEALHHLRGLVRLLRDERIAMDYGLLADDLNTFQRPGGPEKVRGRWGREYYYPLETSGSNTTEDPS